LFSKIKSNKIEKKKHNNKRVKKMRFKYLYLILILTITIDISIAATNKISSKLGGKGAKLCIKAKCSQGGSCGCMPPPPRPQPQPHISPCSLNPCLNGAICQETGYMNGYICVCPPGFMGQNCESCNLI
jgi:hypothetical protein